ncbi:hypothetical protein [Vibrio sp. 10N.261.55.A7]|uniref:hypothetical protein n=1 Tax=Vibrio sp. 10N.261.55.A7 TaxID=1880851 RepID=UPI0012FFE873|nr:hypothetical protein [Vibrio sp. 10N.261.55.A7]
MAQLDKLYFMSTDIAANQKNETTKIEKRDRKDKAPASDSEGFLYQATACDGKAQR